MKLVVPTRKRLMRGVMRHVANHNPGFGAGHWAGLMIQVDHVRCQGNLVEEAYVYLSVSFSAARSARPVTREG